MTKTAMLLIDIQNDFIDNPRFKGALAVPGALNDTIRTIEYIKNNSSNIDHIFATLDTHHAMDIAHPLWWVNKEGENPTPFTLITEQDVLNGTWKASIPENQETSARYVSELAKSKKYTLCIWPEHCLIGTYGQKLFPQLTETLLQWTATTDKPLTLLNKGENQFTEHYSAFKAEVPVDANTELNTQIIQQLDQYDEIIVAGQALSHCVAASVTDLINNIQTPEKVTLLLDACSNVPGFEQQGENFLEFAKSKGVKFSYAQKKNKPQP